MKQRWWKYLLVGLAFGIADWFFLQGLSSMTSRINGDNLFIVWQLLIIALIVTANWGIWLVPAIPAAIYEERKSQSLWRAGLACMIVWSAAIFSYYALYSYLLLFDGVIHLEFMRYSNRQSPTYWEDFMPPFRRLIIGQVLEWIGVAIVGGAVVGVVSALLYRRFQQRRLKKLTASEEKAANP
jgi:hypothetical protein